MTMFKPKSENTCYAYVVTMQSDSEEQPWVQCVAMTMQGAIDYARKDILRFGDAYSTILQGQSYRKSPYQTAWVQIYQNNGSVFGPGKLRCQAMIQQVSMAAESPLLVLAEQAEDS